MIECLALKTDRMRECLALKTDSIMAKVISLKLSDLLYAVAISSIVLWLEHTAQRQGRRFITWIKDSRISSSSLLPPCDMRRI